MCPGREWVVTIHDWGEHREVGRMMEEAFGSVGIRPTIKVTAVN
jgi:hypothetical protein